MMDVVGKVIRGVKRYMRLYQGRTLKKNWFRHLDVRGVKINRTVQTTGVFAPDSFCIGELAEIALGVELYAGCDEHTKPCIVLGARSYIGQYSNLGAYYPITIGEDTMIGPFCHIISGNHRFERRDVPISKQGHCGAPIVVGDDVWVGSHVVILPGVTIGKGAIVAAGAVVNKDIPPYEVWGGVPAKFIKERP